MCRKNGGLGSQPDWVVVLGVFLKLVLGLPAACLGVFLGFFVCVALQGSFARGTTVNDTGGLLLIVIMATGFFFPWAIGPLVRLVFPSLRPYSHWACYPSPCVEKYARILACASVFFGCLCLLYFLWVGMAH